MMRLPSKRELELYRRIKPWFDFLGEMPALIAVWKLFSKIKKYVK